LFQAPPVLPNTSDFDSDSFREDHIPTVPTVPFMSQEADNSAKYYLSDTNHIEIIQKLILGVAETSDLTDVADVFQPHLTRDLSGTNFYLTL